MKVKIGNKIYDSYNEPIMLILSDDDKKNIKNMNQNATKFCIYPNNVDIDCIKQFMKDNFNELI
jgi:hypothetical protein